MRIKFKQQDQRKSQLKRYGIYLALAVLLSAINFAYIDLIAIEGLAPDLLIILCAWIAITEGQFVGIIAAFLCGLIFDVISLNIIGSNALAKLMVGLVAGWFYRENKARVTIGSYKFLIIVYLCSLVHNLVYFFIHIQTDELSFWPFLLKYGIAISFYTTVIAVFPMLLKMPRKGYF